MAIKILVTSEKGGSGKTTVSTELSACFTQLGLKVLLIDLDSQCSSTGITGCNRDENGVYEFFENKIKTKDDILNFIQKGNEYDVMASSPSIDILSDKYKPAHKIWTLRNRLELLEDEYDIILIDTHPGRNTMVHLSIVACDYVIIPIDNSIDACNGAINTIKDIQSFVDAKMSNIKFLAVVNSKIDLREKQTVIEVRNRMLSLKKLISKLTDSDIIISEIRTCSKLNQTEKTEEGLNILKEFEHSFNEELESIEDIKEIQSSRPSLQKKYKNLNAAVDYREFATQILDYIIKE